MLDYPTILSSAGVGIAAIVALWRMNTDLKKELRQDVSQIRSDLRQDMSEIRQRLTLSQESVASIRERVAKLET